VKVVVIGGTGLMGSKVVAKLNDHGHAAIAASPEPGVNALTGEGLADALTGAQVVVDVATAVARTAISQPVGGILEVAGPDRYPLDDLVRTRLRASNDTRRVVTDPRARYFGVVLDDQMLVPATTATVFPTRFEDWLIDNAPAPVR
jgi:uncharacterized protein YbjT (DUF2867 family)